LTLDDILGTNSIELEEDGLKFHLTPAPNALNHKFNKGYALERKDNESDGDYQNRLELMQIKLLAEYMESCLKEGDKKIINADWLNNHFPNTILSDIILFARFGQRPKWAEVSEKN